MSHCRPLFSRLPHVLGAAALAGIFATSPVLAKAFVLPHVLEKSGTINSTPYTFDTQFTMTYAGGLGGVTGGGGADVTLYLYDTSTNLPLKSATNTDVCNPCTYSLGTGGPGLAGRKISIRVDDLITAAGGFPSPQAPLTAYGLVNVTGPDVDNVGLECFVVNSHTNAFDLAMCPLTPGEVGSPPCGGSGSTKRAFVLPHILEKSGSISNTQFTFDTDLYATYGGASGDAQVQLYLFDQTTGSPMRGVTGDVCNPCTANLSSSKRYRDFSLEDLVNSNGGGFDAPVKLGFGVIVVGGSDPDGVNLQGFVVNSHTSAFDLSVFGFEPQPIQAAPLATVPDQVGAVQSLRGSPNPARGGVEFAMSLARDGDVTLGLYDAAGRKVATVDSGRRSAGLHTVRWNGKDDQGAKVASGVYFARLTSQDGSRISKVIYLPQ